MPISIDDIRASAPILTVREAADILEMPRAEKLRSWTRRSGGRPPMVHSLPPRKRGYPTIPLVGLAEGSSLNALRHGGMTMHEASLAVKFIREKHNDPFALANPELVTDGTDAFLKTETDLVRIKDRQAAFQEVLRDHLRPLILGDDGYVERYRLFDDPEIVIDPRFNSGRPSFADSMIPVFPIVGALQAGDGRHAIAEDFDIPVEQVAFVEQHRERFALIA
ncbi:uncharacterized protein (DUF433 family) [Brevibacterium pityocampae]